MNIQRQADQLLRLHRLISCKRTGSPDRLSSILGISKSKLYVVFDELRARGATITYSRKRETFYYENDFIVDIRCVIRPLRPEERDGITGGYSRGISDIRLLLFNAVASGLNIS